MSPWLVCEQWGAIGSCCVECEQCCLGCQRELGFASQLFLKGRYFL
nr:MAG TPA: hypothetical protein [Caudoviricetes sp.]